MSDERERMKGELIDLMAAAARRGKPIKPPAPAVSIKGDGNIVGDHNRINITVVFMCPCGCQP